MTGRSLRIYGMDCAEGVVLKQALEPHVKDQERLSINIPRGKPAICSDGVSSTAIRDPVAGTGMRAEACRCGSAARLRWLSYTVTRFCSLPLLQGQLGSRLRRRYVWDQSHHPNSLEPLVKDPRCRIAGDGSGLVVAPGDSLGSVPGEGHGLAEGDA